MTVQEKFETYNLNKQAHEDFQAYLMSAKQYDEEPTWDNSAFMKYNYQNLFSDIKVALSLHQISKTDFEELRELMDNV
jgi:hypothetical protein